MGVLALEVLAIWLLVSLVAGLALGAVIRKGERARKDEFWSWVFATIEILQGSRS
jgi:hypothetical protein